MIVVNLGDDRPLGDGDRRVIVVNLGDGRSLGDEDRPVIIVNLAADRPLAGILLPAPGLSFGLGPDIGAAWDVVVAAAARTIAATARSKLRLDDGALQ